MKIKDALKEAYQKLKKANIDTYILDAQILLSKVLNVPRWKLIVDGERHLTSQQVSHFFSLIERRADREPLSYITNEKEFFGYSFYVEKGVLIPRPETEILVEVVLEKIKNLENPVGVDVGVGSGAIAVSLLKNKQDLTMFATDISDKALEIASKNAKILGVSDRLKLFKCSVLDCINEKVDFVVSNPPYISEEEYKTLQEEVKKEPKEALIAKDKGLWFYKKIINTGESVLKEKGFFAFEVGHTQASIVEKLLMEKGFKTEKYKDLSGIYRIVLGEKS